MSVTGDARLKEDEGRKGESRNDGGWKKEIVFLLQNKHNRNIRRQ